MDPLSAIGLAASVLQFVQFGLQVAQRLEEFEKLRPGEIPRSLQAIRIQVPLLLNALSKIKTDSEINELDVDTKCILRGVISGCQSQITEVDDMMNEISRISGEPFKTKFRKVFRSLKYDERIWTVERNLNTYISVLILHHVVDSSAATPTPVEDTFFDVREQVVSPFSERPSLMKELDVLLYDASRSQVKIPTIVMLVGPKGAGKTQLALSYCYTANSQNQFRTVFWLDASTLETLSLGVESIYATIMRSTGASREDKITFVKGFLNDLWHPWLLVLDNYKSSVLGNDFMRMLPAHGYGGVILIARNEEDSKLGSMLKVPKFLTPQDQTHLNSLLIREVQNKNVDLIKTLVDQGADINSLIWDEWPILHRCALFGLSDAVEFLLEKGADVNPNVDIRKPIYWAASEGHESTCRLLLDQEDEYGPAFRSADIQSAFVAAAEHGKLDVLRLLGDRRRADLCFKKSSGKTPLNSAAGHGHTDVVEFLVDQGFYEKEEKKVEEAFLQAASQGYFGIVKIFCTKGLVNPNCRGNQGTALNHAARVRDKSYKENGAEMAKFLLANGTDPNLGGGEVPLTTAISFRHNNMIRLLLKHGADPTKDVNGWTPLCEATTRPDNPEGLKILLEAKIEDLEARQVWLNRGLCCACRLEKFFDRDVILQLLDAGADINTVELINRPKGATPLLNIILGGQIKAAQFLIRRGANHKIGDDQGRFPLSVAAENGHDTLVRDLIRVGGDVNLKSGSNEDTLLILAAGKNQIKAVKMLMDNGADVMLANKFGDIALDIAEEKGFKEIVGLLEG